MAKTSRVPVEKVYFDTRDQNGRLAHRKCKNAVSESPVWLHVSNHIFLYKFMRTRMVHCLHTSEMRRNSTSLDSCQHDDTDIVTVSLARRRWTAWLKPRSACVKHFTTFSCLGKTLRDSFFYAGSDWYIRTYSCILIGREKIYYEKFNIFTCRIVSPEINLWFYYYQLCTAQLSKVWFFSMLTIVGAHICRQLQDPI